MRLNFTLEKATIMDHLSSLILFCFLASALGNPLLVDHEGFSEKFLLNNKISGRIVGGNPGHIESFPYQVSLQRYENHFCGGSIISSQWILTAAHCLRSAIPNEITVVVGTHDLNQGGQRYKAQRIIIHPEFHYSFLLNDIALLQISGSLTFSSYVSKIALPSYDNSKTNQDVVVSGWGRTQSDNAPAQLQYLNSRIYDHNSCLEFNSKVSSKNICTYTKGGEGLCFGDSGGPVVSSGVQVGIVSWGVPCAQGSPDIHTRVYSFVDWIKQHVHV